MRNATDTSRGHTMAEQTCTYDDRPVFDGGYFSTPMCEECYGESESDATCFKCGHFPARVITGRITGEAFYRCPKCSDQWQ